MKIWECNGCEKHHMINSEECPGYCFMTGRAIRNDCREVTNGKPPKLTSEEHKLPSWCKVGAWCYHRLEKHYTQVIKIHGEVGYFLDSSSRHLHLWGDVISEARVRPWEPHEAAEFLEHEYRFLNDPSCRPMRIAEVAKKYIRALDVERGPRLKFDFFNLMKDAVMLDGSPCGTLEHFDENRKEWVK